MGLNDYGMMDKEFYLAGIRAEQQRIIKLLEEAISGYGNQGWTVEQNALKLAIALIKGEK